MEVRNDLTLIDNMKDPNLLGQFFPDLESRRAWFCKYRAKNALPPEPGDLELFHKHTGRTRWPTVPCIEDHDICGVRSGKTEWTACETLHDAIFKKHSLAPGEKGYCLVVAPTKRQSGLFKRYLSHYFNENDFFRQFLESETSEEIRLNNNVIICVLASDYRSLRGYTAIRADVEEVSYMNLEGSKPDLEIIRSLRSRLITTVGRLHTIGSPYSRRGFQWEMFKKHWGRDDSPILIWKASSLEMNPLLSREAVAQAYEEDPQAAQADYGGDFRADVEGCLPHEVIERAVDWGVFERPYTGQFIYRGFCDPSGGSGQDSMTLCISHCEENDVRVLDLAVEIRPPFSPMSAVEQFALVLKSFELHEVMGDRYSAQWCVEQFAQHDILYRHSDKDKSAIYLEALPLFMSGKVRLIENKRLIDQLIGLERRHTTGRDVIDHPPRSNDDIANSCCGSLVLASMDDGVEIEGYGELESVSDVSAYISDSIHWD
jgi:hypothetical protein